MIDYCGKKLIEVIIEPYNQIILIEYLFFLERNVELMVRMQSGCVAMVETSFEHMLTKQQRALSSCIVQL